MPYDQPEKKMDSVYSKRIKAGKRRTYFFDVRSTRGNDYFLTITESRKRFNEDGYDRHKIFLYKEDFNKFVKGLNEAVDYVKTELMPDFDFDAFNHDELVDDDGEYSNRAPIAPPDASQVQPVSIEGAAEAAKAYPIVTNGIGDTTSNTEEVDKW